MANQNSTLPPVELLDGKWAPQMPAIETEADADVQRAVDDLNALLFADIDDWAPKH